jgi:predicted XRE-type DNA-binding protein
MNKTRGFDHSGSTFDSFLEEEGILEETEALAIKRVIAWQLKQAMKGKHITKYALAKRLHTSRSQVDRLLHPDNIGVTIGTLSKAAKAVGKRIVLDLVDANRQLPGRRRPRVGGVPRRRESNSIAAAG